ncbi:Fanconi anemia group D2 protein [Colias croceus]|uniref:Fanconi anemia group D2 protein n=1 Tax=Colias crocea TaxID=72248 RepID=UPI001E27FBD3|nr:Fanconi anemia group D2 protein [Colias croceus]
MSLKRNSQNKNEQSLSQYKKRKGNKSYLETVLEESGLILSSPPEKCIASQETVHIIRNIKKNLQKHINYPCNVSEFFTDLQKECNDLNVFKHYLYPNIVRTSSENGELVINDSVIKILLNIPILQVKLIDHIFEKAIDLAADSKCGPWIQMILKSFSTLDNLTDSEKISTNLINLLDIASEKMVRLEIITAIPDIIGDQEHDNIATEMSRILSEDHDLIPAILDCLSYLCLSDDQYEQLQRKTLSILTGLSKCNYFANFVKFLLIPGRMTESQYIEVTFNLRNALGWSTSIAKLQDIASSQVLTAAAIRNSIVSSKNIANAWMKVVSNCKDSNDHKPIDFIILLILYTTSEERQKQVELLLNKHIKLNILKDELIDDAFDKFKPILDVNLRYLINLSNCLLKTKSNPVIQTFATHIYTLMFSKLEECRQTIVAELLQLGLDCKQSMMNILLILNNVALKDVTILKPQCIQMLTLLDRMDDMSLPEIRATMNLLCCLAYTCENSVIRDDIHMIIRKELGSSNPTIKLQGVISGIHAVKYLMATKSDDEQSLELPDDVSYSSVHHLADGNLREAAQIIELISRSTRQFPDMIVFFYDELCKVVQPANDMNRNFLAWLTDAVTNDLQQNFIVDNLENNRFGEIKLTMQHCLNSDSEIEETIAINIGGLVLQQRDDVNICLLPPLFQLVQTLHLRHHQGNLSSIDALLGCPIIMPVFDIDLLDDMDSQNIQIQLDCLYYCVNWIRELINAFASQNDPALKPKIFVRITQAQQLEDLIGKILISTNITYNFPNNSFSLNDREQGDKRQIKSNKNSKMKSQKTVNQDETILPETGRTQVSQNNKPLKNNIDLISNVNFRPLSFGIINVVKNDLTEDDDIKDDDAEITICILKYVLKNVCVNIEPVLISKIKQQTFLSKPNNSDVYDKAKAEEYAKSISTILPNIVNHLKCIASYLDAHTTADTQNDSGFMYTSKMIDFVICLEYIFNMCTVYFKWMGFKHSNIPLLKTSLRTFVTVEHENTVSLKDLLLQVTKFLQKHEKYCLQLSTAVSLIEFLKALQEYSTNSTILKILRETAENFLSKEWKTPDGVLERGLLFNQSIDSLAKVFLINNELLELKKITISLTRDIEYLTNRNSALPCYKSINKANFAIFYRNLGTALNKLTKDRLNDGLTNSEHLGLWKDVTFILKCMADIAKTLDNRNNLSAFFKKSLPMIKLFLSHGIPILEIQFKNETQEVLEILKTLQQSTRFLQSLCCHSRLKKDSALMGKVPYVRQMLETLIYKVKAALTANNCSEAFWMGNLKNKNIHGEVIATQQSVESEESVEDCDEQLPEDEDSDDTDDEMLNPDSKSLSDIV